MLIGLVGRDMGAPRGAPGDGPLVYHPRWWIYIYIYIGSLYFQRSSKHFVSKSIHCVLGTMWRIEEVTLRPKRLMNQEELRLNMSFGEDASQSHQLRLKRASSAKQRGRKCWRLVQWERKRKDNGVLVIFVNYMCKLCGYICNFVWSCSSPL